MAKSRDQESKEKLSFVLSKYFSTNQTSLYEIKGLVGPFVDLVAQPTNKLYIKSSRKAITQAAEDFYGILTAMTICESIPKAENQAADAVLQTPPFDPILVTMEVRALIQSFFFEIRSLFDYMLEATLIVFRGEIKKLTGSFGKKLKQQIRRPNFAAFRHDVKEHKTEAIGCFGKELVRLWLGCKWFVKFNEWRNGLMHGGFFLAVRRDNRDLFRIETLHGVYPLHQRFLPAKMFGIENTVSFAAFSGLYAGLMLHLVNAWSEQLRIRSKLPSGRRGYGGVGGTVCEKNVKLAVNIL